MNCGCSRLLLQMDFFEASAPLPGQRLALFDQRQPLFKVFQVFLLELEVGAALLQRHAQLRQLFGAIFLQFEAERADRRTGDQQLVLVTVGNRSHRSQRRGQ